jgi:hypothetical protein
MFRADQQSPLCLTTAPARASGSRGRADHRLPEAVDLFGVDLGPGEVLHALGEVVVPALGIWLAVGFAGAIAESAFGIAATGDPARLVLVEFFHVDPGPAPALRHTMLSEFPSGTDGSQGPVPAAANGHEQDRTQVYDRAGLRLTLAPGQDARHLLKVAARTVYALTVPLAAGDRVLGAMTIGAPAGPLPQRAALADLARRAATALERAFAHTRERGAGVASAQRAAGRHALVVDAADGWSETASTPDWAPRTI